MELRRFGLWICPCGAVQNGMIGSHRRSPSVSSNLPRAILALVFHILIRWTSTLSALHVPVRLMFTTGFLRLSRFLSSRLYGERIALGRALLRGGLVK